MERYKHIKQEWQRKWREALGERTDLIPDLRDDYTLHFDIWHIGDEKLEECFSIFSNGDRLLKRVSEVRKTPSSFCSIKGYSFKYRYSE